MCYDAPTKFSSPRCGNEWSDEIIRMFKTKRIMCDYLSSCKVKFYQPESRPWPSTRLMSMMTVIWISKLTEKIGLQDMDRKAMAKLVDYYRSRKANKVWLWAITTRGTRGAYFGEPLPGKEKILLREMMNKSAIEESTIELEYQVGSNPNDVVGCYLLAKD